MDLQNNHAKDGMRYPAIDQLVTKTTSKYRLVMAAALRAKQLKYVEGEQAFVENPHSKKEIGIALEEIHEDKIIILPEMGEDN
jgi:DNA-directed RNA polymerase subunit omega